MNILLRILLTGSVLAGVMVLLLALFQRQMIYFPFRESGEVLQRIAGEAGLEIWTGDHGEFFGWRTRDGDVNQPLVVFHGNAGYALHRTGYVEVFRRAGWGGRIHIFEYPGYGAKEGKPSEKAIVEEGMRAVKSLAAPPVLLGESLGTGAAAAVTAKNPEGVKGLILVTPFDSLVSVAGVHYPMVPASLFLMDRYDSSRNLHTFPGPVAFITAEEDAVIPAKLGLRLFEDYPGIKRLWNVRNAGHNDILGTIRPQAWREVVAFLRDQD